MIFYEAENIVESFRRSGLFKSCKLTPPDPGHIAANKRISVCTRCMNRLPDLQQTLLKNLVDSQEYENAEFILLDYCSTDGLRYWAKNELSEFIRTGRLKYCTLLDETPFRPSHSRNILCKLATGDIVTYVDADNFMHPGYLQRINQCMSLASEKIMTLPETFLPLQVKRLFLKGRMSFYKKDLESLGGFDESLDGCFGLDDVNLVFRALMSGFKMVPFEAKYLEGRIETADLKRLENMSLREDGVDNELLTRLSLARRELVANVGDRWGAAHIELNFNIKLAT